MTGRRNTRPVNSQLRNSQLPKRSVRRDRANVDGTSPVASDCSPLVWELGVDELGIDRCYESRAQLVSSGASVTITPEVLFW